MNIKTDKGIYCAFDDIKYKMYGWNKFVITNESEYSGNESSVIADEEMHSILSEQIDEYNKLKSKAEKLSKVAHAGQVDKSGKDYFTGHISTVAGMVERHCSGSPDAVIVALLHDILEDTNTTKEDLLKEFPTYIVDAVVALTKKDEETYSEYVLRAKNNPLSKIVKMCDLANNMDLKRLNEVTEKDKNRVLKYASAYAELMK